MQKVARISKLFGTEGGVLINLYDTFPDDFTPETSPLFVMADNLTVPLWCDKFEWHGANGAFAVFADLDTPERIGEFIGAELYADTHGEGDAAEDEFLLEDLTGFTVEADGLHGTITDFYDSEANPLFEAELNGKKVLIPAAEEFIAGIDFDRLTMKLVLPEGLTDL